MTKDQIMFYGPIIGLIAGFIVGLVPLVLGIVNKKLKYGLIGFILSILAGAFFSLLGAIPAAGIFSWLILREPKTKVSSESAETVDSVEAVEPETTE